MGEHKAVRYDSIAYRIELGDVLAGFALQMANGLWRPFDTEDHELSKRGFRTPKQVAEWFDGDRKFVTSEPNHV